MVAAAGAAGVAGLHAGLGWRTWRRRVLPAAASRHARGSLGRRVAGPAKGTPAARGGQDPGEAHGDKGMLAESPRGAAPRGVARPSLAASLQPQGVKLLRGTAA